ncbi:MAG: VOC family protein [Lachnospiraceae bacterium]|nr:VOC family protein [Lachnospiraceae bacterium]
MMLKSVILECKNKEQLIDFYSKLLNWPVVLNKDEFVRIESPETGMGIEAHYAEDYIAPVWPSEAGKQQMMAHLDFGVNDRAELQEMVDKAVKLGARIAEMQYGNGKWITLLDPAGHPFCIVIWD